MGGIEFSWFPASPVYEQYQKLFRRVVEVGKSEKIIEIGPETAEIEQKLPKIAKIAKISKFGSDFKSHQIWGVLGRFLGVFSIS